MSSTPFDHTYLFEPGRWDGQGKLSIIGGPTEPITLHMIVSHSGAGTITAHIEVNFAETVLGGGVELVYTIDIENEKLFHFTQYNSQLGALTGEGKTNDEEIIMVYQNHDGTFTGEEAVTRLDKDNYALKGTLSLNGIPNSVLEATFKRLYIEQPV